MSLKFKHRILIVDDEVSIINSLKRLFRKEGYEIYSASSAAEAFELCRNLNKKISLIISDHKMPNMKGAQFLEKTKEFYPDAIRFLLTGFPEMDVIVDAVNKEKIHRYITKPWNDGDLLLQVRQSLEQYELVIENRRLLDLTQKQNRELKDLNQDLEKKVTDRSKEIIAKNEELSRLNKELESDLYDTVRAFSFMVDMPHHFLSGHGRRVAIIARNISQCLNLPESEIVNIEIAALLHDIGKLSFSDKLVKYQEEEWSFEEKELFERHPIEGQSIVQFVKSLDTVGFLIRSHHERYDGQGYPDHLKDRSIPTGSKIIAVADTYDKILNLKLNAKYYIDKYVNKKNLTEEPVEESELLHMAAIALIKQNTFSRFDPDIVKGFIQSYETEKDSYKNENGLTVDDLEVGMTLAKPLYTSKGRFLLPFKTILTVEKLNKIKIIHKSDPITDAIHVIGRV